MTPPPRGYDIFIAYGREDRAFAEKLYRLLEGKAEVFMDQHSLQLGDDWDLVTTRAQRDSRASVILISAKTPSTFYQREEIAAAIALARSSPNSHRVVPVFLEPGSLEGPSGPPYGLRVKHGMILSLDVTLEVVAERLLEMLAALDRAEGAGAEECSDPGGAGKATAPAAETGAAGHRHPPEATGAPSSTEPTAAQAASKTLDFETRKAELLEIQGALEALLGWDSSEPSSSEQMILLGGESGVGKSALVQEAAALAKRQGFQVISVVCEPFHEGMSFFPIREIMRQLSGASSTLAAISELYGPDSSQFSLASLADSSTAEPVQRRDALIATFSNLLLGRFHGARSGDSLRPILLTIDDLERIDAGSADALLCLLARLRGGPVLLFGAYRTDLVESTLSGSHPLRLLLSSARRSSRRAKVLRLTPIAKEQLPSLVGHFLSGRLALPPSFYDRLYRETEGNPLFIREILRALTSRGNESPIRQEQGVWRMVRAIDDWKTPESVEEAIRARLDLLDAQHRSVLEVAAAIGRRFAFSVISRLSTASESDLVRRLESFLELDLLHELESQDEMFEFSHGKIRDVLYQAMSKIRRRRLHGEIADALKTLPHAATGEWDALLGEHLFQAGRHEDALPLLLQAARAAMRIHAGTEASGLFLKAIQAAEHARRPQDEELWGIELETVEALKLADDYEVALHRCLNVIAKSESDPLLGRAFNSLGDIHATRGKLEAAIDAYAQSESVARRLGDNQLLLETAADLCELHDREAERLSGVEPERVAHHRALSDRYLDEQIRLAEAQENAVAKSRAFRNRAKRERSEGRFDDALKSYEKAISISDPRVATHSILISYAKTLRFVRRSAKAREVVDRVMDWSTQTGARRSMGIAHQYRGLLRMEEEQAATPEALHDLENALELHIDVGFARGERETLLSLGEWYLRAAQPAAAIRHLAEAVGGRSLGEVEVVSAACAQLEASGEAARAALMERLWNQLRPEHTLPDRTAADG